jgi:membrane associated rhomboid family serine protease
MITIALLVLTVGFSLFAMDNHDLKYKYIFHPYSIKHRNEHYRFLSHAFLHGDYIHLALNMYALWVFGPVVEKILLPALAGSMGEPNTKVGEILFILLYTVGIYASSISEYLKNKNNDFYTSLGASGAINSIVFCYIVCLPLDTPGFYFLPFPAWVFGIIFLSISYYLSKRKTRGDFVDNVGHEAHFWGAAFGAVFTLILGFLNPDVYLEMIKYQR